MQLIAGVLLLSSTALANPCEEPLRFRSVTPDTDQKDVPIDSRILVSFIGQGSEKEFEAHLLDAHTSVATRDTGWCYEHEGPFEKHCWWELAPESPLKPNHDYSIRILTTEQHSGDTPFEFHSHFETGSTEHPTLDQSAPQVALVEVLDYAEEEIGDCDYGQPRRILIAPEHPMEDASRLGVYQIEELRDDSSSFPVHTVFATLPVQERDFVIKQYADLNTNPTGCYRLWIENGAGEASEKTEFCWENSPEDTASEDTSSDSGDEHDSGSTEEAVTDTGDSESPSDPPPSSCSCSTQSKLPSKAAGFLSVLGLIGLRRRSESNHESRES